MQTRSYLDIITEFKEELMDAMDSDECMPEAVKDDIVHQLGVMFDMLWKYSD